MARIDSDRPFLPVNIAVLTVSDTRGSADDRSGQTLVERIQAAGHRVAVRKIVRDAAPENYKFSAIVSGIVNSPAFRMRRAQSPAAPAPATVASADRR